VRIKLLQASPSDPQLWRQNLEATSNSGTWNVIFTGPACTTTRGGGAPAPKQNYVYFDDELLLPNVLSVKYAQNEGSYLVARSRASSPATRRRSRWGPIEEGGIVAGMICR